MRRRFLIGALAVVALIILVLASVFIYIRSGRLDRFLQSQIIKNLAEVGIRAEIGKAHLDLSRPYKVTLQDIKLYAGDRSQPFASLDRIEARFSVLDYLKQKVKITDVVVQHPHLWIEIDKQGKLNLESLHSPPETRKKGGGNVSLLSANYKIEDGDITIVDKRREISAEITSLTATLTPNDPNSLEDVLNNTLDLSFKGGVATYQGRPVQHLDGQVQATLNESSADVTTLKISSDLGNISAQGRIANYRPLKYDLHVSSGLLLDQLSYLLKPGMRLGGKAAVRGEVSGTDFDYHLTAEVASGGLAIEGFTIQGVKVATDLRGHDSTLKGTAQVQSAGATGAGTRAGGIKLGATISAEPDRFGVTGPLSLASLQRGQIAIGNISGKLDANRDRATIRDLSAAVLGGTVTGSTTLAYGGGESRADLTFKSIDLGKATELASNKDVNITGTANGTAALEFPGLRFQQANGQVKAQFDAAISRTEPGAESAPATGQIELAANGHVLTVEKLAVQSAKSEVTATGTLDWNGTAALDVSFTSQDMAEVQRALDALGLIPDDVKVKYELGLEGPGEFKGRVTGRLIEPELTGDLSLSELKAHGQEVGSFTGKIALASSLLRVPQASIVRSDGSRAQFSLDLPIPVEDNISVTAKLTDFDLHVLSAVAAPELADFVGHGAVTGNVSLSGLPGPRTIRGSGEISLSSAEFNVPSQEGEDKGKKVSVPLLTGTVSFDNNVLSVQGLQMRLENSTINGRLSFNFDTYAYSVEANGQNVDLSRLGQAVSDNLDMTGQAEISVKGDGNWDDWSTTHVQANIQGHNVALNGRELGDARLEAHTDNGLLKVDATATLLDKPRTLDAIVDLRDRKNYPVSAKIDFTDEDVGPYLGLLSPKLNSISGKATGTITLGGPLLDTDQIKAVAHLTRLEFGGALTESRHYTITNQGDITVTATVNEVIINPVTFVGEGTSVTLSGTLGSDRSALTVDGTLNLRLISSFSEVLYTTGLAELHATVQGTLGSPRLSGKAELKDVGFRLLDFPVSMAHGAGTIRFTEDQAAIENFTAATPGGGRLTIAGGAALAGLVPDRWRLQAFADQVAVEYPQDTQTVFDGSIVLQGNRQLQVLSGDIRVRRALYTKDVTLGDLISSGGPFTEQFIQAGPGGGGGPGPRINLDIRVDADGSIVVRNNLIDAVASAHIRLSGPIDDPVASGRIQVDRGTTEFQNYRYEITRGMVTFTSTRGAEPIIDLQAEADIGGYHVTIPFTGTPSHLHVNPRSDPQLPANDLVALILTGRPTGDTTTTAATLQTIQTGSGLAQTLLSATLSTELQRQTQRIFGISRVSIDPLIVGRGGQPTARVTISQKVNRNLSFTYSQNVTSGPRGLDQIVLVEYYLSNRLSILGVRDETLGSIGFNIRLRKRF